MRSLKQTEYVLDTFLPKAYTKVITIVNTKKDMVYLNVQGVKLDFLLYVYVLEVLIWYLDIASTLSYIGIIKLVVYSMTSMFPTILISW